MLDSSLDNKMRRWIPVIPERNYKIRSGDVDIAVNEYALRHTVTLVLVHGYPDCSEVWERMIGPLSEHYHVVTYDVRGCGKSTVPAHRRDYSLEWLSQDFQAVIDAASPDHPVHVLAHDWGSIQSWESVTNPRLQKRIKSYTTISGPCLDHIGHWIRESLKSLSPAEWSAVGGQFLHSWYVWMFQLPWLAPAIWKWALGKRWHAMLFKSEGIRVSASATQLQDGVNGIELYRANIKRVARPQLRSTTVPVQQIIPVDDAFVTPDLVRKCAEPWVQQLWSREISATHWAPLSLPDLLARMVREFVDHIEGAAETPELQRARLMGSLAGSSDRLGAVIKQ